MQGYDYVSNTNHYCFAAYTIKIKTASSFETSRISHQSLLRDITEDFNIQHRYKEDQISKNGLSA
jgi:hypothetical protein